jgi:acyl-coenzyme A synthetase/AMP-(fatty) acid ligase
MEFSMSGNVPGAPEDPAIRPVVAERRAGPVATDPDAPTIVGFTSGTTRDPKGVVHSHRTIGCETRQLDHFFPTGGPPQITGAPVGHFIGMLNAFLVPLLRERPVVARGRRAPPHAVGEGAEVPPAAPAARGAPGRGDVAHAQPRLETTFFDH